MPKQPRIRRHAEGEIMRDSRLHLPWALPPGGLQQCWLAGGRNAAVLTAYMATESVHIRYTVQYLCLHSLIPSILPPASCAFTIAVHFFLPGQLHSRWQWDRGGHKAWVVSRGYTIFEGVSISIMRVKVKD